MPKAAIGLKPRKNAAEKIFQNRWAINQPYFDEALIELGIFWKVRITRTFRYDRVGHHKLVIRNGEVAHYICVNKYLSKEGACKTLLHELQHAVQAERHAEKMCANHPIEICHHWGTNEERSRDYSYEDRPIEIDARKAEERFKEFLNIVRME